MNLDESVFAGDGSTPRRQGGGGEVRGSSPGSWDFELDADVEIQPSSLPLPHKIGLIHKMINKTLFDMKGESEGGMVDELVVYLLHQRAYLEALTPTDQKFLEGKFLWSEFESAYIGAAAGQSDHMLAEGVEVQPGDQHWWKARDEYYFWQSFIYEMDVSSFENNMDPRYSHKSPWQRVTRFEDVISLQ